MPGPRTPVLAPIDQSTDAALVMNTVYGETLSLSVNGRLLTSAEVDSLRLRATGNRVTG